MANVFSDGQYIHVDKYAKENHKDFIEGYKFCSMGVMSAIRNTFSHGDEERRSPEECFEMIMIINWLLRSLDRGGA